MSKNVSNNFKNVIKAGGPFYSYAVMTLADGTVIELTSENDFSLSGSMYSEDSGSGFPLGSALSKSITLTLDNTIVPEPLQDTTLKNILDTQGEDILTTKKSPNYDYYYARIALYTEADLPDGTIERIQEGIFTVIDSVTPGDVLEITAYDDMYKTDVKFTSTLTYPASAQMLLNEVCSKCDITLGSVTFKNNNFQIQQAPTGLTGRQVIGYIAQIAGGNAVIDRTGHLIIKSYDFSGFDTDENVTAGEIETGSGIHIISEYTTDPVIGTDDVTITGVSVTIESEDSDEDDKTYIVGSEEYAISIDNPLIIGQEKAAVDLIAESVVGITIRPFSGEFFPNPTVEFMDLAYVLDRKDAVYKSFITMHDFAYVGSSSFACEVESPERHGGSYYSSASEVYQKAKKDIEINKTQWEQAIENLSQQVANASGLYTTEEIQPDGSTIFYMHNKPTLEESDIVWMMTAETLTVSTDGGQSWNAGITVNGEVIARIMSTIGINFDWGVGGTLIIQDNEGNQTAYIDAETGVVRMSVQSLKITGKTVEEIASEQSDSAINDFVDAVYNPDIQNLQAQIDGQIETWFYDYLPATSNYPASEWTTDTEKDKHLGDLFYVVDNEEYGGQAYRWAKINNVYQWDYVEDTAVTKALADAASAQDTADQKRRVFITTPVPPYDVGDLWAQGGDGDLLRCVSARSSGAYSISDWDLASKYTDDTNLNVFINGEYADAIKSIEKSIDQKSETWYQATDPSINWTDKTTDALKDTTGSSILDTTGEEIITTWESEKVIHEGDLWKDSTTNIEYIYQNGEWVEMPIPDDVFDEIDGKAQIFVNQPTPPYAVGDLWFNSSTSDIMTCIVARESGNYNASDWEKRNKYTDDTKANEALEAARNAKTLSMSLSNDYQGIPTDYQGNYGSAFPTVVTTATVLYGTEDVSNYCSYSSSPSSGVTGSWNGISKTYVVTALTTDNGYVDISATYQNLVATKRFVISKIRNGTPGENGDDGRGIVAITEYYLATNASSGVTTDTSGWTTIAQSTSPNRKYLWNYEIIRYTDNNSDTVLPRIIGTYGDAGSDGVGIQTITNYYLATSASSGVTVSTPGWTPAPQSVTTEKKYLWNYEITHYTNDLETTTSPHIIGVYGDTGETGAAGRTYFVELSSNVLKRGTDNKITPPTITAYAYYREGISATRTAYAGRWVVQTSTDGTSWNNVYTSNANESSKAYSVESLSASIVAVRFTLYAAGGTSTALDMQSATIVNDVDSLTQEDVFNKMTNNGAMQGLYIEGDQLYVNASYIRSGILTIGGVNNSRGILQVLNSAGGVNGIWNNSGIMVGSESGFHSWFQRGNISFYNDTQQVGELGMHPTSPDEDEGWDMISLDSWTLDRAIAFRSQTSSSPTLVPVLAFYPTANINSNGFRGWYFGDNVYMQAHNLVLDTRAIAYTEGYTTGAGIRTTGGFWIEGNSGSIASFGQDGCALYGDTYANIVGSPSDERLKDNIADSDTNALDIIQVLDFKEFDWIVSGEHEDVGLIAQEVEQIAPALVSEKDEQKYINTTRLLWYCAKAIQELAGNVGVSAPEIMTMSLNDSDADMTLEEKQEWIDYIKKKYTPVPERPRKE